MISDEQRQTNLEAMTQALRALRASVGGEATLVLADNYPMPSVSPESGEWYFVADCVSCGKRIPFLRDESRGDLGNPFSGTGSLAARCPECGAESRARAGQLSSDEWA